jgi:hypothetical protein
MRKSQADPTTAENLEAKFDRGEGVLDYFNVRTARIVRPKAPAVLAKNKKATSSYAAKSSSQQEGIVRDRAGRYRGRKKK